MPTQRVAAQAADKSPEKQAQPAQKITYDQHIKPIFREHCLKCHNGNEQKGGLALDNYGVTMEGGASGEVVFAAELDSSRLWSLVNHDEKPVMPPNSDRIADAKLALIRQWIEQGALENSGSKRSAAKKPDWSFKPTADANAPGAMPENWLLQPVTTPSRSGQIASLACSPRAPLVAISGFKQVSLYHADTEQLLGIAPFPEGTPYIVRFSRDGSLLIVGGGRAAHSGYVALYNVKSGNRVARVGDELDAVMTADIDASLQMIAIGDTSKLVKVFDIATGETRFEIKKHTDWVTAVSFSPDGKWLATGDRAGGLVLWEAETGREYMVFDGHGEQINAISWRADSKVFATASEDSSIRVWQTDNRKAIRNWAAHGQGALWVEFASNGDVVTCGRDQVAKLWDGNGKGKRTFAKMEDIALRIAVSSDAKRLFVGDWKGNVKIVNHDKPEHVGNLLANPPTVANQLAAAKKELARREQLANATKQKHQAANNQVVASTKKRDDAVTKLADVEKRLQELKSEEAGLRQQLATLEKEVTKTVASVDPAKKVVANTENGLKSITQSLATLGASMQSENAAVTQQRSFVENLQSNQQALENRMKRLSSSIESEKKRIADFETQLRAITTETEQTQQKIAAADQASGDTETPGTEAPTQTQLKETLANLATKKTKIESELEAANAKLAGDESKLQFLIDAYAE